MNAKFQNIFRSGAIRPVLLALLCLLISSCSQDLETSTVLKVGTLEIGKDEVRWQMAYMGLGAEPKALTPELRKAALDAVAQRYLIIKEAQQAGVKLEPEELDREEQILRGQLDEEVFEKSLRNQGLEYYQWRKIMEGELLCRKMLGIQVSSQIKITAEDIKTYYDQHNEDFKHKRQILALHIVLPTKSLAYKARNSLKSGKKLNKVCQELGITPLNDGEAVWLEVGHMPEALERKLFAVRANRVAGPYKSAYGYHVIKVLKKRKAGTSSLDQATERIRNLITDERKQELADRWLNELNRKTEVWFDPGFIKEGHSTGS
jgi:foldase protein PrsA